jgi:hypothetical protein
VLVSILYYHKVPEITYNEEDLFWLKLLETSVHDRLPHYFGPSAAQGIMERAHGRRSPLTSELAVKKRRRKGKGCGPL